MAEADPRDACDFRIAAGRTVIGGVISIKVTALSEGIVRAMLLNGLNTVTEAMPVLGLVPVAFEGGLT